MIQKEKAGLFLLMLVHRARCLRLSYIFLRILIEIALASGRAEVIRLALIFRFARGRFRINIHSTYWIFLHAYAPYTTAINLIYDYSTKDLAVAPARFAASRRNFPACRAGWPIGLDGERTCRERNQSCCGYVECYVIFILYDVIYLGRDFWSGVGEGKLPFADSRTIILFVFVRSSDRQACLAAVQKSQKKPAG